jgi:intracellular sulfur oxidation DsrE/DsrF family protein
MFNLVPAPSHRRGFLARVGASAAAAFAATLPLELQAATRLAAGAVGPEPDTSDRWLAGMRGKHRQLFDMPSPSEGHPQLHILNFLNSYRDAYKVSAKEVNTIGTLYGQTVPLAFNDAMWAKYPFGARLKITDPSTGAPLARNMFAHPKEGDPFAFGQLDASIERLQQRGTLFLLCNNALTFWIGGLAKAGLGTPAVIRTELLDNLLPGVVLVPAMVVAINKAQAHGFSYIYQA